MHRELAWMQKRTRLKKVHMGLAGHGRIDENIERCANRASIENRWNTQMIITEQDLFTKELVNYTSLGGG